MQWASSTTNKAMRRACSIAMKEGSASLSGVAKTISLRPATTRSSEASCSARGTALLNCSAAIPASSSFSTWSFIRAMSGDTTTVVPSRCSAGNW
jgi:hypothetical protein